MNDADNLLKVLEDVRGDMRSLQAGQKALQTAVEEQGKAIAALQEGQKAIRVDIKPLQEGQQTLNLKVEAVEAG